jgi:hypothetical protein
MLMDQSFLAGLGDLTVDGAASAELGKRSLAIATSTCGGGTVARAPPERSRDAKHAGFRPPPAARPLLSGLRESRAAEPPLATLAEVRCMIKQSRLFVVALGALAFGSLAACMVDDGTVGADPIAEESGEAGEVAPEQAAAPDQVSAVDDENADAEVSDEAVLDEGQADLEPGRYCVDQSHASIQFVDIASCGGLPCSCPPQLTPHAQFTRNHPVNVKLYGCGPYFFVKDLWSDRYGWMRQDALRPC